MSLFAGDDLVGFDSPLGRFGGDSPVDGGDFLESLLSGDAGSPVPAAVSSRERSAALLTALSKLGANFHPLLLHLSSIACPVLPDERSRAQLLQQMFEQSFFDLNADVVQRMSANLCELCELLHRLPFDALLLLSSHFPATAGAAELAATAVELQRAVADWHRRGQLESVHRALLETPPHMHRVRLVDVKPELPWMILPPLAALMTARLPTILSFAAWYSGLPQHAVTMLGRLLATPLDDLNIIRNHVAQAIAGGQSLPPSSTFSGWLSTNDFGPTSPLFFDIDSLCSGGDDFSLPSVHLSSSPIPHFDVPSRIACPSAQSTSDDNDDQQQQQQQPVAARAKAAAVALSPELVLIDSQAQLTIVTQPNAHCVSQRLLKPAPQVRVQLPLPLSQQSLFVECTLVRSDTSTEIAGLSGTVLLRLSPGGFLVFDKLRVQPTTQQRGTRFRLRFALRSLTAHGVYTDFPSVVAMSQPFDVHMHAQHLSALQQTSDAPVVDELVPPSGPPGCRVAVLGSRFVKSAALRVLFDGQPVVASFHESGTLLCNAPAAAARSGHTVDVHVTNDGKIRSAPATFTFL